MTRIHLGFMIAVLASTAVQAQTNVRRFTGTAFSGANLSVSTAAGLGTEGFSLRVMSGDEQGSLTRTLYLAEHAPNT